MMDAFGFYILKNICSTTYSIFEMRDWCKHYSVQALLSAGIIWSAAACDTAGELSGARSARQNKAWGAIPRESVKI
jgi:hypothetical protein